MMKPKNPKKKRRTLREVAQDISHKIEAKKGSRKIKKTLKDKAKDASEKVDSKKRSRLRKKKTVGGNETKKSPSYPYFKG